MGVFLPQFIQKKKKIFYTKAKQLTILRSISHFSSYKTATKLKLTVKNCKKNIDLSFVTFLEDLNIMLLEDFRKKMLQRNSRDQRVVKPYFYHKL